MFAGPEGSGFSRSMAPLDDGPPVKAIGAGWAIAPIGGGGRLGAWLLIGIRFEVAAGNGLRLDPPVEELKLLLPEGSDGCSP